LGRVVADQDLHHGHVLLRPVGADRGRVEDMHPLLGTKPRHMLLPQRPDGVRVEVDALRQQMQRGQGGGRQAVLR